MLEIDGIPPRLAGQFCEGLLCQEYRKQGRQQQEVDALLIRVNGRWHHLYFDCGIVFWRQLDHPPESVTAQPGDPFTFPLLDIAEKYGLRDQLIASCDTEPLPDGAEVRLAFAGRGELVVRHIDNRNTLHFIAQSEGLPGYNEE